MVFNDAAFRTQQWESELQLAGDQYRMQAAQQATGALQQVGSQWSQQRNQNAQFGAQMGMQQQELDQNAAMVHARLQLMEQERQENAIKLQSLQQLDQAKISRETTRSAELQNQAIEIQNRAREFDLRKQEKMFSTFDEDRRQGMLQQFDPRTIEGLALQDMVLDVPDDGGPLRIKTDKEGAATIRERISTGRRGDRTESEARLGKEQELRDRGQRLEALQDMIRYGSNEQAAQAEAEMSKILGFKVGGGKQGAPKTIPTYDPNAPNAPNAPQPGAAPTSYRSRFNHKIGGTPIYSPDDEAAIDQALVNGRDKLVQHVRARSQKLKDASDEQIMDFILYHLGDVTSPFRQAILQDVVGAGR